MEENEIPEINLYSDGGAEPNPGKGGFGVIMSYKGSKKEFNQGFFLTTNNRMELMGVIYGLEKLKKKCKVNVFSDSRYVIDGITQGWAEKWKANNWYRNKTEKATNIDLWEKLLILISKQHEVKFNWIKGHCGHTENERCDELANLAINNNNLLHDEVYESNSQIGFQNNTKKITVEGDECRKCNTPVIIKTPKKRKLKSGQEYYYEYYLHCPNCKTLYMIEDAKRFI
ncbi:ribonuclease HI [Flavobacterium ustbae]|uniref:ribonuclease HI n=1 Tax=Flavobacterium ustbae TaxID=2488790 RepID=UPI0019D041AE|nr:ribonuclease HI [Flavobacterium ustbae]